MDEKAEILIVEDERIIAMEMRHKLESMGYDIPAIVSSGEEAIEKAEELSPDLVLMDIVLTGGIDGAEAASQIRTRFDIPVVYVTANISDARLEDIKRTEPFGCLFKPFEDVELHAAIKMALYKHKMEKDLRKEMNFTKTLLQASPAFFVAIGADGKTIMMNESMLHALGYTANEVVGKDYTTLFVPEKDQEALSRVFEKLIKLHDPTLNENCILTKDGRELLVEWHGRSIFNEYGKFEYFFGTGIDITARKQAEKALRDSEKKYRTLAETTNDVIYVLDLDGNLTYVSPLAEKYIGRSWQDLLGRPFAEFIAPEYVESTVERFKKGLGGEKIPLYEIEMKDKNGEIISIELNVTSLLDATGKTIGRIGVARDITARKQAEEDIKSYQKHLALINQILRHDLTNDLVVIQSALNLYNKAPEEKLLQEISSRTEKSLELIKKMRGFESFMSRHRKLQICEIGKSIDEIIKNYPSINFDINGNAHVMADDSLSSVIDNIVGNAVIHGKADSIAITMIDEVADMCEVRITDNGTGIPDDIKKKIFEKGFTYGDNNHTGLGLHIVERAMENYGGYTWVEDNKPKGTAFILRFKRVK